MFNEKHIELENRLKEGRESGILSSEEEDLILDEMEILWYKLSDKEKNDSNERARKYYQQCSKVLRD